MLQEDFIGPNRSTETQVKHFQYGQELQPMPKISQEKRSSVLSPLPVTQDVAGSSPVHPATFQQWQPSEPEGFPSFLPEGFFVGSKKGRRWRP